ncbi:MAG: bifunctional DNA-formamidopyrimidine glycosylase/DNA-(apurinic or apyrimidinic site) lyase [Chloroflexi bacterium]|nr:bifunctional DNA-formamidopyrimidine glycosylase/DNA-(apurinic or apyrimidinic site) lyase [Chloroflexota bacterium]
MPELPEVQTILDALTPLILNIPIRDVLIHWPGVVDRPPTDVFRAELRGRAVISTWRRGKYMLFGLDDGNTLVMHLRMTGKMRVVPSTAALHKHDRLSLRLANDHDWRFKDQRKFGRAYLVADAAEMIAKLGPEPLGDDFTAAYLHDHIAQRRAPIKSLLLDQRLVAGIGNIYADEILFMAHIHPRRPGADLSLDDTRKLVEAIRHVLQQALAEMGTTLRDYRRPDGSPGAFQNHLQVFRRTGQPCYACGAPIQRIVVGGRSTHFCPREQPA